MPSAGDGTAVSVSSGLVRIRSHLPGRNFNNIVTESMCLIAFAWQCHPDYPLLVAANRDEFYKRPAAPARFWAGAPAVLAGRDLVAGGTWMGVTRSGRFAALTNYRDPRAPKGELSRGLLVSEYLQSEQPPLAYASAVAAAGGRYAGFSLLLGQGDELVVVGNRGTAPQRLTPGIYALSNHLLNTPWPKVERARQGLQALLLRPDVEGLLTLLAEAEAAPEAQLPDTGVGAAMERMLSPLFIRSAEYGTRASTVLLVGQRRIRFVEQSFGEGMAGERADFEFDRLDGT